MNTNKVNAAHEQVVRVQNGWVMLVLLIAALLADAGLMVFAIKDGVETTGEPHGGLLAIAVIALPILVLLMTGFFTLQPNQARVLVLFGAYKGTVRTPGFHWGNPFYSRGPQSASSFQSRIAAAKGIITAPASEQKGLSMNKISLRARNLNGEKLKVNDKRGNPIEIAAVLVWRVEDTAQAMFDVDDYVNYVSVQSESALRHLASCYAYDHGEENEVTLRSGVDEVSQALKLELQERLSKAGVVIEEARLTHLAYAPEIAQAMLRRQQAEAVIDARQRSCTAPSAWWTWP